MYARTGFGGFGDLGVLPGGMTSTQLISALSGCGGRSFIAGITGDNVLTAATDCAWESLWQIIQAMPDSDTVLMAISESDCVTAASYLGLPSEVSAVLCGLAPDVWTRIQNKAAAVYNSKGDTAFQEAIARGRERTPAEGCGRSLIDESGVEIADLCDDGLLINPGERCFDCPEPATGTRPSLLLRRLPLEVQSRPGGYVTGTVVGADGTPIYDAAVRFASPRNRAVKTAADGSFRISGPAFTAPLYIVASGYADFVSDPVTISSGGTVSAGALVMTPGEGGSGNGVGKQAWYTNKWTYIAGVPLLAGLTWVSFKLFSGRR
jgi:hypothetical protein